MLGCLGYAWCKCVIDATILWYAYYLGWDEIDVCLGCDMPW